MSQYDRRVSLGVGVVLLAVFAWSLWISRGEIASGPVTLTTVALVVGGSALLLGGLSFVLAGLSDRIALAGRTIEWWQLRSLGFAFLGSYMAISGIAQDSTLSLFGLLTLAAGFGFVAFGIQQLRTGLPADDAEPSARQIAVVVVGTMVCFLLMIGLMLAFA
ncbi:hypothetical protein ACLI4Z_03480 [Natrialbaceae archaeon A-arb3/5]